MNFACICGTVIYDQTDFLANKAYLIADQDWEDFAEASQSRGYVDHSYARACYQCPSCGRLHVDDNERRLIAFAPEATGTQPVLRSIKGELWKAPLIGAWTSKPFAGQPNGDLYCDGAEGGAESYDTWEALEQAYFALFFRLKGFGLLRSALLRKDGKQVHTWQDGDR
ncbi:hypothetical protein EGY31_17865 [Burkholderia multivorans]|nr:hypothetical protein EGY31_17865 [Burkholderia multivorans]VWC28344.1 hypothetical protein BUB20358_06220 [Burkholderia ubonensis]